MQVVSLNLMIIGYAQHGKDLVAEMLRDYYGFHFVSSSYFMAERVILPKIAEIWDQFENSEHDGNNTPPPFPKYADVDEAYTDRVNHRQFWYDTIKEANEEDPSYLSREIFSECDLYVGIRNRREFNAAKCAGLFDFSVWVDRSDHVGPEDVSSNTLEPWMADYILDNNGTIEHTTRNVHNLMEVMVHRAARGASWRLAYDKGLANG